MIRYLAIPHQDKRIIESVIQDYALGEYKFLNAKSPTGRPCIARAYHASSRFTFTFADEGKLLVLFRDNETYETVSMYFHMLKDEIKKQGVGYAT
tara:strand:- start:1883 stop:2167 length:285 start_codon:yes stop_codon:yes gene_type:complete